MSTRPCPFCAEEIQAAAVKCKHCQSGVEPLPAAEQATSGRVVGGTMEDYKRGAGLVLLCVIVVLVGAAMGNEAGKVLTGVGVLVGGLVVVMMAINLAFPQKSKPPKTQPPN